MSIYVLFFFKETAYILLSFQWDKMYKILSKKNMGRSRFFKPFINLIPIKYYIEANLKNEKYDAFV